MKRKPTKLYLQMGSTLMEVLISMLVLAFGLLGMAGMQSVSLRNNQSAFYRTQATTLTADMIERMRANKIGVEDGDYDDVAGAATASCFLVAGCTPGEMADQDVLDWTAMVAAALPGGDSVLCIDATGDDGTAAANACDGAGNVYAIKIWWDDNRDGVAEQRYVTTWQPL